MELLLLNLGKGEWSKVGGVIREVALYPLCHLQSWILIKQKFIHTQDGTFALESWQRRVIQGGGSDYRGCTLPTVSSSKERGGASKLRKHNSIWIFINTAVVWLRIHRFSLHYSSDDGKAWVSLKMSNKNFTSFVFSAYFCACAAVV